MPSRHIHLNIIWLVGIVLAAIGAHFLWEHGIDFDWSSFWSLLAIWLGVGIMAGGAAIVLEAPEIYCKHPFSGILPNGIWIYLGGWLVIYRGVWLLKQAFCLRKNDRMFDLIDDRLILGRLTWELPAVEGQPEVDMVVDVTCEWSETPVLRSIPNYMLFSVVDTTRPPIDETVRVALAVVKHLQDPNGGSVYLHCANGYGRSAVVAAAVLLASGRCTTPEDAMALICLKRPVASFRNRHKRAKNLCESLTHAQLLTAIHEELQRSDSSAPSEADEFEYKVTAPE